MSNKVEKRIVVDVPVSTAYNQWTQFEDFPHFMDGVESVTQLSDNRLKWVARIAGIRREWEATILEQVPDSRLAWASTGGATNAGAVEFSDAGGNRTEVALTLEYLPEGMLERVGELLHAVGRQAEHDLKKFKKFIEHAGHATGEWRKAVPGATQGTAESRTGNPPQEYNRFAHPFDQTGGLVDLMGEADGSAEGEAHSRADRRGVRRADGTLPPLGGSLGDR
jgi:hypothetical protein